MNAAFGLLGFEFQNLPWMLGWLLVVPVALGALFAVRARRLATARIADAGRSQVLWPAFDARGRWIRWGLSAGALAMLCLAIIGPSRGHSLRDVPRRGLDLVFCVDASRSMLVEDMGRSRLDEARRQIAALLQNLEGDRVGLITFAGDARLVVPLTRDQLTFQWFLERMGPDDHPKGGTDLAAAIDAALEVFDGRTGNHEAIVLITDGEDHSGRAVEAAAHAKAAGIRVDVLGMGSEGGGKIMGRDGDWIQDADGNDVVSRLETATLERLAKSTQGHFAAAAGSVLNLERLYHASTAHMEGRTYDSGMQRVPHDRFQWPLFVAVLLLFLRTPFRDRRRVMEATR